MATTIRAAPSVAMLLGFHRYALMAVVLLGVRSLRAIEYAPGVIAGKAVWVTLAAITSMRSAGGHRPGGRPVPASGIVPA